MAATSSSALVPSGQSLNLLDAITGFEGVLEDAERGELKKMRNVPDADAILVFTAELDASHRNRRGPSYASRLHTILSSVGSYCGIIDTCVSSHPEIAALVWGTMKLTMLVLSNFTSFYAATSGLFMKLGRLCPPFADYQALYPDSSRLQRSLGEFHASIIRCCSHLVQVTRRTTGKRWVKAFLESFDQEFKPDLEDVQHRASDVEHEIRLAHAQAVRQDQQLQVMERQEAKESRRSVHRFISRMDGTSDKIQTMQVQRDERRARERRQQLVDSLSSRSFLRLFKQNCRRRHCATTDWIFETPEFKRWFHEDQPVLCLSGKIGSGKTVATSSVIQYIQRFKAASGSQLCFFFVQTGDMDSLTATAILKSILQQMVESSKMTTRVENALQSLHPSSDTEDILEVLLEMAPTREFYIIVDGIDECDRKNAVDLLKALSALVSCRASLRLFLSGRPSLLSDINRHFIEFTLLSMESPNVNADIAKYIADAIDLRIAEDDLRVGDAALVGEIKSALIKGAQGMFLWAFFQIEEICSQHCDADIRAALVNLPENLAQIFRRALHRIATGRHTKAAQNVFPWITCSKRLLTLAELREAIAIKIGQKKTEPGRLANDMDKIATWCQNLVYVDEESLVVQCVHNSVRNFLLEESNEPSLSMFHLDADRADHKLGEICLTYLDFDVFNAVAIRPKPLPVANPIGIVNYIAKPMSKKAKLLSKIPIGSPRSTFDLRPSVDSESSRAATNSAGYDVQHPFLAYASRHWISHTTRLQEATSTTWHIFRQIIIDGHSVAKYPWNDGFQLPGSAGASLECVPLWDRDSAPAWAWQNGHYAATCILAPPDQSILQMAAFGGNYNLFDAIWDRPGLEDPIKIMVYGAMIGHLRAVESIIAGGYNVDTPVTMVIAISKAHATTPLTADEFPTSHSMEYEVLMTDTKLNDPINLKKAFEAAPDISYADMVAIPVRNVDRPDLTLLIHEFFIICARDGNPQGAGFLGGGVPGTNAFTGSTTALMEAIKNDHGEVRERLLAAGARKGNPKVHFGVEASVPFLY